jgi:hypothetical protein
VNRPIRRPPSTFKLTSSRKSFSRSFEEMEQRGRKRGNQDESNDGRESKITRRTSGILFCSAEMDATPSFFDSLPLEATCGILGWLPPKEICRVPLSTTDNTPQASAVCKGWYKMAHDTSVWKFVCEKTFGASSVERQLETLQKDVDIPFTVDDRTDWRSYFWYR